MAGRSVCCSETSLLNHVKPTATKKRTSQRRAVTRQRGAGRRTACSPACCRTRRARAAPPGWAPGTGSGTAAPPAGSGLSICWRPLRGPAHAADGQAAVFWCLRKRATAALIEAHASEQWHRHSHTYAASFMAGDFACMTCLTAAHEIHSTCAGCTCDASHCARHMVIQLVHFLSPHAHRVCVQQLHQKAELLETARSIAVRELSHKESVSEHRLSLVSDKTASVHSTLSTKSVVLHTEYSVLYSTQSTVVV